MSFGVERLVLPGNYGPGSEAYWFDGTQWYGYDAPDGGGPPPPDGDPPEDENGPPPLPPKNPTPPKGGKTATPDKKPGEGGGEDGEGGGEDGETSIKVGDKVRCPDGSIGRVTAIDSEGNAEVEPTGEKE